MTSTVTRPAINVLEKLAQIPDVKDTGLTEQVFSGDASKTVFTLASGYKPYAVYVDGTRKLAATYTVTYAGTTGTITFGSAPASGTNNIQIDTVKL